MCHKKGTVHSVTCDMNAVSMLKSREQCYIKVIKNNNDHNISALYVSPSPTKPVAAVDHP